MIVSKLYIRQVNSYIGATDVYFRGGVKKSISPMVLVVNLLIIDDDKCMCTTITISFREGLNKSIKSLLIPKS